MNRRGFFGTLIPTAGVLMGVSAEPVIQTAHFSEHPSSALARFNQEHAGGWTATESYKECRLFFSGFTPCQENNRVVGQWRAMGHGRYWYAPVPWHAQFTGDVGAWEYFPGEPFRLDSGVSYDDFADADKLPGLSARVVDGRRRLIALLDSL